MFIKTLKFQTCKTNKKQAGGGKTFEENFIGADTLQKNLFLLGSIYEENSYPVWVLSPWKWLQGHLKISNEGLSSFKSFLHCFKARNSLIYKATFKYLRSSEKFIVLF